MCASISNCSVWHIFQSGIIHGSSFHLFSTQNYVFYPQSHTHTSAMSSLVTFIECSFLICS